MNKAAEPKLFYYTVFGLHFASELEMPMLQAIPFLDNIDVHIKLGTAPERLENPQDSRVLYDAKPNHFLMWFKIYPVRYYVTNGNLITIHTGGHEDWDFIRLFLLTAGFGALLHQRKVMPLHASGILIDGGAVLFSGESGAGKSTTAAAFREQGYTLVADDVAVIHHNEAGQIVVEPGVPFVKLWQESFGLLDKDVPTAGRIREEIEKYIVPTFNLVEKAVPVRQIYILEKSNLVTTPVIKTLSSIETVNHLRMGTYRYYYLIGLSGEKEHFKISFDLGNQGIVKHLTRPMQYPVADLVAFIEADLKQSKTI